jgi:hypothetical protein
MNAFGIKIKKSMVRERRVRTKRRIFFPNEGIYFPKEVLYWFEFDSRSLNNQFSKSQF